MDFRSAKKRLIKAIVCRLPRGVRPMHSESVVEFEPFSGVVPSSMTSTTETRTFTKSDESDGVPVALNTVAESTVLEEARDSEDVKSTHGDGSHKTLQLSEHSRSEHVCRYSSSGNARQEMRWGDMWKFEMEEMRRVRSARVSMVNISRNGGNVGRAVACSGQQSLPREQIVLFSRAEGQVPFCTGSRDR
eukprot:TRINITY_DN63629_c0_g1_i1.p1 TRINITY_DN63629_c0_g1~~TRINITY_DN63629_c0_g1_i1.p1  ORF type:complete len:190 (-),score=19.08 TRINITY_DN63629_c0_g1_i1:272-841(-)